MGNQLIQLIGEQGRDFSAPALPLLPGLPALCSSAWPRLLKTFLSENVRPLACVFVKVAVRGGVVPLPRYHRAVVVDAALALERHAATAFSLFHFSRLMPRML